MASYQEQDSLTGPLIGKGQPSSQEDGRAKLREQQVNVYFSTFMAYAMNHFSRKCYTNVKVDLEKSAGISKVVLSQMDTAFMAAYAVGSFFMGSLGDRYHAPTIIAIGLFGSAVCVVALVWSTVWNNLTAYSLPLGTAFLLANWLVFGVFQAIGGPVGTAVMGNWFGPKNRGLIFGTWTCHQYAGNVVAALVASYILSSGIGYEWAVLVPAITNALWGFVCLWTLPASPEEAGCPEPEGKAPRKIKAPGSNDPPPISILEAFKIPSVAGYALAFGFFKLVNYVLFFWLPFFLNRFFTSSEANVISTLYDVGMMPGGIIVGFVSDLYGGRRACVIVSFLSFLCPLLWFFAEYSDVMPVTVLMPLLLAMGCLVGGPNNIITSAVSADLAGHPSIAGNSKALGTVTGIINGSGSITAALGMSIVGPLVDAYGWGAVWYFLIVVTIIGCLILAPRVTKEIYDHEDPNAQPVSRPASSAPQSGYQSIDTRVA